MVYVKSKRWFKNSVNLVALVANIGVWHGMSMLLLDCGCMVCNGFTFQLDIYIYIIVTCVNVTFFYKTK